MSLGRRIMAGFIASLLINIVGCLQCYECIGSESSDCARGINTAAVAVNCTPRILRPKSRTYLRRVDDGGSGGTTVPANGFRPLDAQEPFIPYPACVTFTKVPRNGRNLMVHRRCLVSGENFCKEFFKLNAFAQCQQCNNTDFCL